MTQGLRVPLGSLPETWFARTPLLAPHKSQFSTHLTTGLQASEPSDGPGWPLMAPQERGNPALVMERKTSRKGREVGSMISSSLASLPGAPATRSSHNPQALCRSPTANSNSTKISDAAPVLSDPPPILLESEPITAPHTETDPADTLPPSLKTGSRTKPIPIPTINSVFRRDPGLSTTPLTGRLESRAFFPQHYNSLEDSPTYKSSTFPRGRQRSPSLSSMMVTDRPSRIYTPSSPLSPTMNPSLHPMSPQPSQARPPRSPTNTRSMQLNLPRYHPQKYQSSNIAPPSTSQPSYRPSSPLGNTLQPYRAPPDSQKTLRQHQRDLIAHARLSSNEAAIPGSDKPTSPRLDPLGSPGPVTPLMLEEEGGYLAAGAGSLSNGGSPVMSGDEDSTDLVDKFIRKENKRWEKKSRGSREVKGSPVLMARTRD